MSLIGLLDLLSSGRPKGRPLETLIEYGTTDRKIVKASGLARKVYRALEQQSSLIFFFTSLAALFIIWQYLIIFLDVPLYILPKPTDFISEIWIEREQIFRHAFFTTRIILISFTISVLVAVPLGLLIISFRFLEEGLYPIILFIKIVPKTIMGPLIIVWIGIGDTSNTTIVILLTFFPILVDSMAGFRTTSPNIVNLVKTMGASTTQTFFYVRLPDAMPFIFSGMKIGMVTASAGVIMAEFIGASRGLGYLILDASSKFDMPLMFSSIMVISVVGALLALSIPLMERWLMPWKYLSEK